MNKFSMASGYKITIQKSVAYLHTNNELSGKKIKKTIPLITAVKNKILRINIIKEVKDLYTKNYKTLMKEIEDT